MGRKKKNPTKTVSARVDLEFKKRVIAYAKEHDMSVCEFIKFLLEDELHKAGIISEEELSTLK